LVVAAFDGVAVFGHSVLVAVGALVDGVSVLGFGGVAGLFGSGVPGVVVFACVTATAACRRVGCVDVFRALAGRFWTAY
jgi:hypothetical protein